MKETTALRDGLLIFVILLSLTLVSMAVFTCSKEKKKKKDSGCIGGCGCGDGGGCGGGGEAKEKVESSSTSRTKVSKNFGELLASDDNAWKPSSESPVAEKTLYVDTVHSVDKKVQEESMEQSLLTEEVQNLIGPGEEAISQPKTTQSVIRGEGFTEECTDQAIVALPESNVVVVVTKEKIDLEAKLQRNTRNLESRRLHHRSTYHIVPPPPLPKTPSDSWLKRTLPTIPPKNRDFEDMSAAVIEGNDAVTGHIISTTIGGKNGEPKQTISYMAERAVGTGSFGIVFQAKCLETGESVAIKKVLQDRHYKNRELQLMRLMDHPNVVSLKHCFFSTTSRDELFLNLVMEYVPETLYRIFRGLAYIHTAPGVCHRDLKPQNLLVRTLILSLISVKLCDFGSAKILVKGEANISYICSRYYRAPDLIFGATEYTSSIDIWSAGCVLAELLLGQPLFPGENSVDQLVEIIKVLGTPTREEIRCMNPNYTDFRFPQIKAHP
ncbi:hypothetical protein IGI04_018531 [Brassica rapa subsp. trilocularis]|uniref:non-specific serine/threonine protein kinase n=1 Tax=Brassica rapa subsp. trilocularis TaxID=1813537 RepID=A0ABQ7MDP3_BRACM|nr:hypothetical protein IGI04_018531 [Brassica rapa subsp. trilocularis]